MDKNKKLSIPARITEDGQLVSNSTGEVLEPTTVLENADIYITEASSNSVVNLATGIAINKYEKKSWEFLKDVSDFNDAETNIYKFIDVCDKLYRFEPVVGTAIDLFVNYTLTNFKILTDNAELNKIIDYLNTNINKFISHKDYLFAYPSGLNALAKEIASEWFIAGNVFPFMEWRKQDIDGSSYKIPFKVINLNPTSIRIERSKSFLGGSILYYSPSGYLSDSNGNGTALNFDNTGSSISNTSGLGLKNEQVLDHRFIYHVKRKPSGYKLWGIPYLTRTFSAIKSKRKLRYLDDTTIEGLANYIIVFKIGSDNPNSPYHKVTGSRLSSFKSLIENPQASNMIVWPHDINVITVGPDGKVLDFKDRYEVVDRDIIRSLGVPPVLLDGTGSQAISWVPILALVERLEDLREAITDYLTYFVSTIASSNSLDYKSIDIKWSPANLRDEQQVKTFLLSFYDRGLLPIETTLEQLNYNTEEIVSLKKKEKKAKYDEVFARPDVPFSPVSGGQPSNRSGDMGRQPDNTFNKPKDTTSAAIVGTFKDTLYNELDTLYEDLKSIRKVDAHVSDTILGRFLRIKNIADVFIDMELNFVSAEKTELFSKYKLWVYGELDKMLNELTENLTENLLYLRKESVANFVTAGVFSSCKTNLDNFCDDVLYSTGILIDLSKNKESSEVYLVGSKESKKIKVLEFFDNVKFEDIKNISYRFA